jgi:CRISPR system Cascade subunit CasE
MTTNLSTAPDDAPTHDTAGPWLSRLLLDPGNRQVHHDLRDASALHRRVMSLVPDGLGQTPRARAGALFRLETDGVGYPVLLVQTLLPPDSGRLPQGYARSVTVKSMSPMVGALRPGLAVRYRLLANTVRRCGPNSTAGKWKQVIALRDEEARQWWATRAEATGLGLHSLLASPAEDLATRHQPATQPKAEPSPAPAPRHIRRATTLFEGTASVQDPQALRRAILQGVGRSKSYGCGLLSLAPDHR